MATAMIWGSPGSGKTVAATAPKNEKILLLCSDNSSVVLNMFDRPNVTVERVEHWIDPGDGKNYFTQQFETARTSGKYSLTNGTSLTWNVLPLIFSRQVGTSSKSKISR